MSDPRLLTPAGHVEDAAAYLLDADRALLFTTDYFTPVVDDPYLFGQIAAANAFSDVYAMGGSPMLALNLLNYPARRENRLEEMASILRGGADKAREAGCLVVGGHTVDDPEPKYGLAVVGMARPDRLFRKGGARPGDLLYLTKRLGTGILATAFKGGDITEEAYAPAVASMTSLNRPASEAALEAGVGGATDVTGFGLLGHLLEMCREADVSARVVFGDLPFFDGVEREALQDNVPGGTRANLALVSPYLQTSARLRAHQVLMAADAQTSGGLLLAVSPDRRETFEAACASRGQSFWLVGRFEGGPPRILVE
jgi:selenide,water dikinase